MSILEQQTEQEEQEIRLLKEWLPKMGGERRAYIKGAAQALLYAQEGPAVVLKTEETRAGHRS